MCTAFPPSSFIAQPARRGSEGAADVCTCFTYHKPVKAAQVHEKEFESVSIRDGPYQEDCPQVSKRQARRKQLST